jgi:hypothetical protein
MKLKKYYIIILLIIKCVPIMKKTNINYYSIPTEQFSEDSKINEDTYCAFMIPLSIKGVKQELLLDLYFNYSKLYSSKKIVILSEQKFEWFCEHFYRIKVYKDE